MQIRENSQRNSGVSNEKTNKICSVVLICLSLSDNDLVVTKTEINMLIVFANQKGGVGKSTLALLFSDYLGMAGYRCRVLDCDKQQSIVEKYLLDLTFEGIHYDTEKIQNDDCPVPVNPNSLFRIERLPFDVLSGAIRGWLDNGEDSFTDSENDFNIFDMPGQLDIEQMEPIFRLADAIITPTSFSDFDNSSTLTFTNALRGMNLRAKRFVVPNAIMTSANYSSRSDIEQQLLGMGCHITPDVARTVNLSRNLSTMFINPYVLAVVENAFAYIIKKLK